jgi:hypothetical protein
MQLCESQYIQNLRQLVVTDSCIERPVATHHAVRMHSSIRCLTTFATGWRIQTSLRPGMVPNL